MELLTKDIKDFPQSQRLKQPLEKLMGKRKKKKKSIKNY